MSVLIRCYQSEQTLLRAIVSVLTQTVDDLECLVVDDGSTDGTGSVISRIRDARVRSIRLPTNLGRAAALKIGIALSRAECIGTLDSDDWWYPTKLERQLDVLARERDVAFVTTNMALMSPDGAICAVEGVRQGGSALIRFAPMSRPGERRLPHPPSLFRAAVLRQAPIDLGLVRCSDLYLTQEVMLRNPCAVLTEPLYAYSHPRAVRTYEDSAAAARRVYAKFFRRYPVTSAFLQSVCIAKRLAYRATAATGLFGTVLDARGLRPAVPEVEAFFSARAALERAILERPWA